MLTDATLKLLVGLAVGVGLYYNYKKNKIEQQTMEKPSLIGRNPPIPILPFELNKPHTHHKQKQHTSLTKTNELPIF